MLHSVFAVGYAEAKLKVEALKYSVAEVVFLNHAKLVDWLITHRELNAKRSNSNVSK